MTASKPGDERDLLRRVEAYALEKCKLVEQKPSFRWGSIEEMRTRRYPFERDLAEYCMILKDLRATLQRLPPSAHVLDIGAGRGIALDQIRQQFGLQVTGTGISHLAEIVCPFVEAVASDLPFPNGTFDLVISFNALSWEPDQVGAVEEVRRVLKPQGVALIYLHPFTYSVWLTFGDSFWDEIEVDPHEYRRYEFSPQRYSGQPGITIAPVALHHPSEKHKDGYYLVLHR